MAICEACAALEHQAATIEPHAALAAEEVLARADGEIETWRCHTCGMLWQRVNAKTHAAGEAVHFWLRLA